MTFYYFDKVTGKTLNQEPQDLLKLLDTKMPYGKYSGRILIDLPEPYVVWYHGNGLPKGELGRLLGLLYEIKANGLEYLLKPLRGQPSKPPTKLEP